MTGTLISFLGSTTVQGGAVPQVVSNANPLPVTLSGGIGGLAVAGTVADSSAVAAQFPVTVGGVDYATGFAHRLNTDSSGRLNVNVITGGGSSNVSGTVAAGGSSVGQNPVTTSGADAGNIVRTMLTDTSGRQIVVGAQAVGVVPTLPPVMIGVTNGSGQVSYLPISNSGAIAISNPVPTFIVATSVTPLGALATYNSGTLSFSSIFGTLNAAFVNIGVFTDQAGTLNILGGVAGSTLRVVQTQAIVANTFVGIKLPLYYQSWSVQLVNGGVAQTILNLSVTTTQA